METHEVTFQLCWKQLCSLMIGGMESSCRETMVCQGQLQREVLNGLGCGGAGGLDELAGARATSNWQLALELVVPASCVRAPAC